MNKIILSVGLVLLLLAPSLRADFFADLEKNLVQTKDGKAEPFKPGEKIKFTAVYYSAHWCPPCRAFTPKLVAWYKGFKPKHADFELVFASSDKDEAAMLEYMKETGMPWPAVKFGEKKSLGLDKYAAGGIPYLVPPRRSSKKSRSWSNNGWDPVLAAGFGDLPGACRAGRAL